MRKPALGLPAQLVLRFVVIYGGLLVLAVYVPVYAYVEWGASIVVDAMLELGNDDVTRSLEFSSEGDYHYVYRVSIGERSESVSQGFHAHAFFLLLYLALVAATPGLGWRRALLAAAVGGVLCFGMGVGMLMSDVRIWDRGVFPSGTPPFLRAIDLMDSLHRSSGPGLLPVVLWVFVASGPLRRGLARGTAGD